MCSLVAADGPKSHPRVTKMSPQIQQKTSRNKETLMKIASLMKKNESRNERKEELMRLTNMLEAKMRPNVKIETKLA